MKKIITWTGIFVAAAVLSAGAVYYHGHVTNPVDDEPRVKGTHSAGAMERASWNPLTQKARGPAACDRETLKRAFADRGHFQEISVQSLVQKFSGTISNKRSQLELLRFRHFVKQHYPDDWDRIFRNIIAKAFPGHAEEILATLAGMDRYNAWLEENKHLLATMPYSGMKQALWEKRAEIFREDTEEVWAEESKVEMIRDTIAILDESYGTTIDEKMEVFKESAEEASASDEGYLQSRKYNLTTAFLGMHSVQDELSEMAPDKRAEALSTIRAEMGFTPAEMKAMEKRDAEHSARWEKGLAYMEERNKITGEYAGPELDEKMAELREHHFNHDAATIEAEEKSGFFRFTRRRVYGRN